MSEYNRRDLIRLQKEWEDRYYPRLDMYKEQQHNYNDALLSWQRNISKYISDLILPQCGQLNINVNLYYDGEADNPDACDEFRVYFSYESQIVSWDYTAFISSGSYYDDGATWDIGRNISAVDADELVQSANAVKAILSLNWDVIVKYIKDSRPKYIDYVTIQEPYYDPEYKNNGYDIKLKVLEFKEALHKNIWFRNSSDDGWIKPTGITKHSDDYILYEVMELRDWDIGYMRPDVDIVISIGDRSRIYSYQEPPIRIPIDSVTQDEFFELIQREVNERNIEE